MVEEVVLAHRAARRTEEGSAGPVVAHKVAGKEHLGCPRQILYAAGTSLNFGRQCVAQGDEHFVATTPRRRVGRPNGGDDVFCAHIVHGAAVQKAHLVAHVAPGKAPCLVVAVGAAQRVVVEAFGHFKVNAVHVDGIVHHALEHAVAHLDGALALRKVRGVGLRGEVAQAAVFNAYVEAVERDVLAAVDHESHALGVVHL